MIFSKRLLIIFISFLFVVNQPSFAADESNPYIVEDVAVSVSAKSPTEARNLAVKTGRRDAFVILLTRLSLETAIANKISDDEVLEMVRSEQIVDEKIAGSAYSAAFNVTFAKDFVDHILAQKNLVKQERVAVVENSVSLVVPVKILQRKILLWEGSNDWGVAVKKALYGKENFKIPIADTDNTLILNSENVNKVNAAELEPLFSKYQSKVVYFLLFSQESLNGKASVVVRALGGGVGLQAKLSFANVERLEGQELMNKVAGKTIEYLESLKNSDASAQNKSERMIFLEIPITKLGDWLMIKNKIETSGFAAKLSIDAISCDYVKASILVASPDLNLVELFAKSGFSLTVKTPDLYLLTLQ